MHWGVALVRMNALKFLTAALRVAAPQEGTLAMIRAYKLKDNVRVIVHQSTSIVQIRATTNITVVLSGAGAQDHV